MSLNNTVEILHIEDNTLDAFLIKSFLAEPPKDIKSAIQHYNITNMMTLKDGIQSLENLENNFQIILLDLNLPDGSGINNIKTIREINSNIPIVIVTSVQDEKIAMDALRHGAQECLVKEQGNGDLVKRIIQSSIFRKKVEIELAKKAYYDDLTSLPNRLFFENAALNMIRHAKRWNRRDALMFIDLNKFKIINDTHGHEAGNIVLKEIAERLRHTLRDSDLIARYAGDEFVVYMDCGRADITEELCTKVAEKIIKSVEHPIKIGDINVEISLSIGIALYPDAGQTFEILLKNADQAMYKAKKSIRKKYQIIKDNKQVLKEPVAPAISQDSAPLILIIDDCEIDRSIYKQLLNKSDHHYNFLEAETIHQAFQHMEDVIPDCILLDYNLPDKTGLEFLSIIEDRKDFKHLPIIMITQEDRRDLAVQVMGHRAKDFIIKNEINPKKFIASIESIILEQKNKKERQNERKKVYQSNTELVDFSNTIAHDLKAPMRKIISYCELLNNDAVIQASGASKSYIDRMSISATRMKNLIENLLSYAQTSHFNEEKKTCNLKEILQNISQDLTVFASEKKAEIIVNDMPDWPVYKVKFEQIMLNLITNGIKYSYEGRNPIVSVSGYICDQNQYHIQIKDNGQGIPTQYKHKILKPFQRLHRADDIEGSGLGLAICLKAIEKHNGEFDIHSVVGEGTDINIMLP